MCYSGKCVWENYHGDCRKPYKKPCPMEQDESDEEEEDETQ